MEKAKVEKPTEKNENKIKDLKNLNIRRHEAILWLGKEFPLAFLNKEMPPLKIGIRLEILNKDIEGMPPKRWIKLAIARYTSAYIYLTNLKAGTARIDLQGLASGEVTEAEEETAKNKLKNRDEAIARDIESRKLENKKRKEKEAEELKKKKIKENQLKAKRFKEKQKKEKQTSEEKPVIPAVPEIAIPELFIPEITEPITTEKTSTRKILTLKKKTTVA